MPIFTTVGYLEKYRNWPKSLKLGIEIIGFLQSLAYRVFYFINGSSKCCVVTRFKWSHLSRAQAFTVGGSASHSRFEV